MSEILGHPRAAGNRPARRGARNDLQLVPVGRQLDHAFELAGAGERGYGFNLYHETQRAWVVVCEEVDAEPLVASILERYGASDG